MSTKNYVYISRRNFLKILGTSVGAVILAPYLAGCAVDEAPGTIATSATIALPTDVVAPLAAAGLLDESEIIVAYYEGPEADRHVNYGPDFTPYSQGKVQVVVETLARDVLDSKFATAMQAGEYIWDVVVTFNLNLKQIAEAKWIEPLNQFMDDPELFNPDVYDLEDIPELVRSILTYEDQLYMLPMGATAAMLFYRKDLFEKWGIPEPPAEGYSWTKLREVGLQIKEHLAEDGMTDTYPLVWGGRVPTVGLETFQAIWSWGHEVFDSEYRPHFSDPKAIRALQFMTDLIFKDEIASPGIPGYEFMEVFTSVQQENAVMALQYDAAASMWADAEMSPQVSGKLGYVNWPYAEEAGPDQPRIVPVINSMGIPTSAEHKRAAFEYLLWFTSKEPVREMVLNLGGNMPRTSIMDDPELQNKYPHFATLLRGYELYHDVPQLNETLAILFAIVGPHTNAIFAGESSVEEAVTAMDNEITQMLTDSGVIS